MGENCDIIDIRHSFLDINAYEKQSLSKEHANIRAKKAGQAKAKTVARLDCEEDGVINEDDEELTVPQGLQRNKRLTKLDRKTLIDGQVAAQGDISKHVTYLIFGEIGYRACEDRENSKRSFVRRPDQSCQKPKNGTSYDLASIFHFGHNFIDLQGCVVDAKSTVEP
ncbi:hypothetical protein COP1_030988 [Malus domestica]